MPSLQRRLGGRTLNDVTFLARLILVAGFAVVALGRHRAYRT